MATVRTEFPRKIHVLRDVFIPMKDGVKLAAQIWLPVDADKDPVPAILEYLPYRKRDGTTERDARTHPYYAGFGYAGVRVDIRGTGDSEGTLYGEYTAQEQDDAVEVIAWLAKQTWCSGTVGMIGISWGGFNGLQVAARRPKALKAVVSLCSTDDRYADDIHAMGGCLLVDKVAWGSTMFSILCTPPDPQLVGERWRQMWIDRMGDHALWLMEWHENQRRGALYKHGSVCEDYKAIKAAVYLVGGWADGYSNPIFRMLKGLKCPKKALIGPWAHKYPHFALPGPQIGFLRETLRWWDQWLKGKETGIMEEPMMRAWLQHAAPPSRHYAERPGHWVAEEAWPSKRIKPQKMKFGAGTLGGKTADLALAINSPMTLGQAAGKWCPYGLEPDQADDQRIEAGGSLVFDTAPLAEAVEMLGAPVAVLEVSADKPVAMVAAVLSDIHPDGAATRVSYGLMNLTHRESHEHPTPITPGERYTVRLQLNEAGQRFEKGHRIRLAISSNYWPIAWPMPEKATITVHTARSRLELPARPEHGADKTLKPFLPPESSAPIKETELRHGSSRWWIEQDQWTGLLHHKRENDDGLGRLDEIAWTHGGKADRIYSIHPNDPDSAVAEFHTEKEFGRDNVSMQAKTHVRMTVSAQTFDIEGSVEAFENGTSIHKRSWKKKIPRDLC